MPPLSPLLEQTLRSSRLFADLPPALLGEVAAVCGLVNLAKGDTLFFEGQTAEGFFLVAEGAINLHRVSVDGHEQVLAIFRAPDSFAEATLNRMERYPATAVALQPSRVVRVGKAGFSALLAREPGLSLRLLDAMGQHLRHLVTQLEEREFTRIEGRLAQHLLRVREPAAVPGHPPVVRLDTTKKVLAGRLGVTSETLSRTLARFKDEGLIAVERSTITLKDVKRLAAYLEE